jgi:hypothetical protein
MVAQLGGLADARALYVWLDLVTVCRSRAYCRLRFGWLWGSIDIASRGAVKMKRDNQRASVTLRVDHTAES